MCCTTLRHAIKRFACRLQSGGYYFHPDFRVLHAEDAVATRTALMYAKPVGSQNSKRILYVTRPSERAIVAAAPTPEATIDAEGKLVAKPSQVVLQSVSKHSSSDEDDKSCVLRRCARLKTERVVLQ